MNLSAPFISRPVATTLLSLSVVMVGALGYTMGCLGCRSVDGTCLTRKYAHLP